MTPNFPLEAGRPFAPNITATGLTQELMRRQATLAALGLAMLVAAVPTALALLIETRTFNGINLWIKPLKFEVSIAVHALTLAWFWPALAADERSRPAVRFAVWLFTACAVFEISYIALQAGRGQGSHFNETTVLTATLFRLMGAAATAMVLLTAWIGFRVLRNGNPALPRAWRTTVGVGLIVGGLAGCVTGFAIGNNGGHWVGGVASDIGGAPIFGWSRTGGDLRVAHFFGLHAMQAIPLAGALALRYAPARTGIVVAATTALWTAATAATLFQALAGKPFLPG